jgi:Bacterial TSP3 repeat
MSKSSSFASPRSRVLLFSLCALVGAVACPAEVIYHETFSGAGDAPLAGRPPAIRAKIKGGSNSALWIGPVAPNRHRILANGVLDIASVDFEGASAFLPFRPVNGAIYLLKIAGVNVKSGDWVGTGFTTAKVPDGNKRFRDNSASFWALVRRQNSILPDQTFTGPNIVGPVDSTVISSSSITVLLDTSAGKQWQVRWFLDGHLVRSGMFAPQAITHVGFGFNATAAVPAGKSSLDQFTLEALDAGADSDADGLPDFWEIAHFRTDTSESNWQMIGKYNDTSDPDGDGFTNLEEFAAGSDPLNPRSTPRDTDGDGLADSWEIHHFGAIDAPDAQPANDPDGDGFTNLDEFLGYSFPKNPASTPATNSGGGANASTFEVDVSRSGNDVFLAWTKPNGEAEKFEIYRGTSEDPAARTRVATVNAPTCIYLDLVPSAARYWYWLGTVRTDGKTSFHGPYVTKDATVWQP